MRYISDDGKCIGSENEVRAYEERKNQENSLDAEVGKYLDSIAITEQDGSERPLNPREFTRRERVIKEWLLWDIQEHPERYQEHEPQVEAKIKAVE